MTTEDISTTPLTRRDLRAQAVERPRGSLASATRRGAGRALGDMLLWVAAAAGAVCVALAVFAFTANITLIMFSTGSMTPAIPTGSVAVVQRIPASEIHIGDVVTVDREGKLPITHRVTSIEPGATDDERVITMRGDANADEDPFPYTVTSVRVVLFSIPGIATVIAGLGNPHVLSGITLAASLLVVWAFWPRRSGTDARAERNGVGS